MAIRGVGAARYQQKDMQRRMTKTPRQRKLTPRKNSGARRRPGMGAATPGRPAPGQQSGHQQSGNQQSGHQQSGHLQPVSQPALRQPATPPPHAVQEPLLQVAVILGAHGVKGQARLKVFIEEPMALGQLSPITDANGKIWKLKPQTFAKGVLVAALEGLRYRDQVEALKGLKLFVSPSALPATDEDEFYPYELEGLRALRPDGSLLGEVVNLRDYGAGDLLNVRLANTGKLELFAFTKAVVPEVKISEGYLVIDTPGEIISRDEDGVH